MLALQGPFGRVDSACRILLCDSRTIVEDLVGDGRDGVKSLGQCNLITNQEKGQRGGWVESQLWVTDGSHGNSCLDAL